MATIKEIKEQLADIQQLDDPLLAELEQDSRSGVIQAIAKRKREIQKCLDEDERLEGMLAYEKECYVCGIELIAGAVSYTHLDVYKRQAIDHQLMRKEKTDTDLLEKVILNNLGQSEFFINKAIGWSLRNYSKVNPDWVGAFIDRYREQLSPLSIREGSKYRCV